MPKAVPEGFHNVTPYLVFKDARKAIEFYKQAFGAQERFAMPGPGGEGVILPATPQSVFTFISKTWMKLSHDP